MSYSRRVKSLDPFYPKRAIDLAPLPGAIWKPRCAWRRLARELWVFAYMITADQEASVTLGFARDKERERRDGTSRSKSARVLIVLDTKHNKWRREVIPFEIQHDARPIFNGENELLLIGGKDAGDVTCRIDAQGHIVRGSAVFLPLRGDHSTLIRTNLLLVGSMLICMCSGLRCERTFTRDQCPCCDEGTRLAPSECCSSIQVLDLERRQAGWFSLPTPPFTHLADLRLSLASIYVSQSRFLCITGLCTEHDMLCTEFRLDLSQLARRKTKNWERRPFESLRTLGDRDQYGGYFRGHIWGKLHAIDRGAEVPALVAFSTSGVVGVHDEILSREDSTCEARRVAANGIWIDGSFRWKIEGSQEDLLFGATSAVVR